MKCHILNQKLCIGKLNSFHFAICVSYGSLLVMDHEPVGTCPTGTNFHFSKPKFIKIARTGEIFILIIFPQKF